ncbi:MAG: hypothetical protein H0T51_00590 [Pirellulales bacterium]|nr:hypothetical protein [Pirellulales bacterium]
MNVQQIEAIRDQTISQIQDLLATAGPTISVNGADVVWAPLLASLQRMLDWCDGKLTEYQPYEVRSRGET